MTRRKLKIIVLTSTGALVLLALAWGLFSLEGYFQRSNEARARQTAANELRLTEEREEAVRIKRHEAANKIPLVTLGGPRKEPPAAGSVPGKEPVAPSGLSVVTLGGAKMPSLVESAALNSDRSKSATGLSLGVMAAPLSAPAVPVTTLKSTKADLDVQPATIGRGPSRESTLTATPLNRTPGPSLGSELLKPTTLPAGSSAGRKIALTSLAGLQKELAPPLEIEREKNDTHNDPPDEGVKVVSGFECSATLKVERVSDTHLKVAFTGKRGSLDNYFLFRVEGAKGRTVRIDFLNAPLNKWWSLNPVYSYVTDLSDPANFESHPPEHPAEPVKAWNGPLLPDTSGEKWHFMPNVWSDSTRGMNGTLSMVHTFEHDAYVGLKVPYRPSLNERLMAGLKADPLCEVVEIGTSPGGRKLQMVRIGGNSVADKSRPRVLMYAREHGTEQDSSWVVEGAIRFLLSDDAEARSIRNEFTFLLLPVMDPDGAAASYYDRIPYSFKVRNPSPEALLYATWFERWCDGGKRLDIALNMHNVESAEAEHLFCMYGDPGRMQASRDLHAAIVIQLSEDAPLLRVRPTIGQGYMTTRLGGWVGYYFGPLPMLYEVNSQDKTRHLAPLELSDLGQQFAFGAERFLKSKSAQLYLEHIDQLRDDRSSQLALINRAGNPFETALRIQVHINLITHSKPSPLRRESD